MNSLNTSLCTRTFVQRKPDGVAFAPLKALFALTLAAVFTAILASALPQTAYADPNTGRAESIIREIDLGESTFRLITDRPAIPTDGAYSYIVEITPGADLVSVNLHFQLMREENGWPFHYFGDSIYIERPETDTDNNDAEQNVDAATENRRVFEEVVEESGQDASANANNAEPEVIHHILQRRSADNLVGLGMVEGIYYVAVIVTATTDAGAESATLQDLLVVYDPEKPSLNLMPVVHLNALPSRDANGVFLSNPQTGVFEKRRSTLEKLSDWINANQRASLTLALSPLFLEELNAVSLGFDYYIAETSLNGSEATPTAYSDETTNIPAESEVSQAAIRTIDSLRSALSTGRLILTTQGYADPNITVLEALGLLDEFETHVNLGQEVTNEVLGEETPPIVVPWADHLSEESLATLQNVFTQPRIIVDSNLAEQDSSGYVIDLSSGEDDEVAASTLATRFSYEESEILVADANLSSAMSVDGSRAAFIQQLLDLREGTEVKPVLFQASEEMSGLSILIENLELLSRYNWVSLKPGDLPLDAATNANSASFSPQIPSEESNVADAATELQAARDALMGLSSAFVEPSIEDLEEFEGYYRASFASFAGPGVPVSTIRNSVNLSDPAPECLALARHIQSYVDNWFEGLAIDAQPITFSGASGVLPITVQNASGHSFALDVRYQTPGPNVMIYPEYASQTFAAGESFLEPVVELRNIVSGSVDIRLMAGDHLIAEESVRVSATYADRIAIIVLVALAGTGLAFYVWRRVQKGERADSAALEAPSATSNAPKEAR